MNSMKLVIPLLSLYWSIHTKDESKSGTAFAFIFGVVASQHSLESFFHEIKCSGMTSFMEFMTAAHCRYLKAEITCHPGKEGPVPAAQVMPIFNQL